MELRHIEENDRRRVDLGYASTVTGPYRVPEKQGLGAMFGGSLMLVLFVAFWIMVIRFLAWLL